MAWAVLIISGLMEGVWATALGRIDGFHKIVPLAVFIVGLVLSMSGLAYAMKSISVGTAYAVWTGIGAVTTVVVGIINGTESVSMIKIILLIILVSCIVGLKLVSKA